MKKIAVFGGSGGLGKKLIPFLEQKYEVISLSSKDVDVTNFDEVVDFFNKNKIFIVLNISGKNYDTYLSKINNDNLNNINDIIDVNIKGNINILSGCLPKMIENKWGRVITISSVLSDLTIPKTSIYSASKSFTEKLINIANKENVKFGITCNTIQLGYWDGGMCNKIDKKQQELIKNNIGLKRWGKTDELYNTINYIIDNEYFCGSTIKINGGL